MYLTLRLSPSLQYSVDGKTEFSLQGETIGECISAAKKNYAGLSELLFKANKLNPQILLFHNNTLIREDSFDTSISEKDVLDVVPAIEAG